MGVSDMQNFTLNRQPTDAGKCFGPSEVMAPDVIGCRSGWTEKRWYGKVSADPYPWREGPFRPAGGPVSPSWGVRFARQSGTNPIERGRFWCVAWNDAV